MGSAVLLVIFFPLEKREMVLSKKGMHSFCRRTRPCATAGPS